MSAQQQTPGQILGGCAVIIVLFLGGFWLLGTIFGGGGGGGEPAAAPATSAPAPADTDLLFIATLKSSDFPVPDPQAAITAAHATCTAFGNGADLASFGGGFARESGLSLEQTGQFIGAAVAAYCPQHRAALGG